MRRRTLITLCIAAALAGCGDTSSSSDLKLDGEQQAVAEQVEALQSGAKRRDAKKICADVLAKPLRERLQAVGAPCARELEDALGDIDDTELEVLAVTVSGDSATARVRAGRGAHELERTLQLVRESGTWRISGLGS